MQNHHKPHQPYSTYITAIAMNIAIASKEQFDSNDQDDILSASPELIQLHVEKLLHLLVNVEYTGEHANMLSRLLRNMCYNEKILPDREKAIGIIMNRIDKIAKIRAYAQNVESYRLDDARVLINYVNDTRINITGFIFECFST